MSKIISGRCAVVTFILEVPPDVDGAQCQQVLPAGIALTIPLAMQLAFPMRGSFIEVKEEPAEQVASRYNARIMKQYEKMQEGHPGPKAVQ